MNASELLEKELSIFNEHKHELLCNARGQFVLIHGDEIIGTYHQEIDAVNEGYRRFGNVPFFVRLIDESTPHLMLIH